MGAGLKRAFAAAKATRMHPEQALQIAAAEYLTRALPDYARFTAFPAGGGGRVRGARLKAMGLKGGVPDLLFWWRPYVARSEAWNEARWLFGAIELKAPGKYPTTEQRDWLLFF